MSTPAHDWIEHLEHPFQPWAQRIHVHLLAQNGVSCRMRYGVPFYDRRSWVCYLHRIKKPLSGLELAFIRAHEFTGHQEGLYFGKRKQVGGMRFFEVADFRWSTIAHWMEVALELDERTPYASKRSL